MKCEKCGHDMRRKIDYTKLDHIPGGIDPVPDYALDPGVMGDYPSIGGPAHAY